MHIYDDFFVQLTILILVVIAILFLFDMIVDPFKLNSDLPNDQMTDTNSSI